MMRSTCRRCGGSGVIVITPCALCKGSGQAKKRQKVTVPIPAGRFPSRIPKFINMFNVCVGLGDLLDAKRK